MSDVKTIFSGCGHEVEKVIADMRCPVCMAIAIERLEAELEKAKGPLPPVENLEAFKELLQENERLREALQVIADTKDKKAYVHPWITAERALQEEK